MYSSRSILLDLPVCVDASFQEAGSTAIGQMTFAVRSTLPSTADKCFRDSFDPESAPDMFAAPCFASSAARMLVQRLERELNDC